MKEKLRVIRSPMIMESRLKESNDNNRYLYIAYEKLVYIYFNECIYKIKLIDHQMNDLYGDKMFTIHINMYKRIDYDFKLTNVYFIKSKFGTLYHDYGNKGSFYFTANSTEFSGDEYDLEDNNILIDLIKYSICKNKKCMLYHEGYSFDDIEISKDLEFTPKEYYSTMHYLTNNMW